MSSVNPKNDLNDLEQKVDWAIAELASLRGQRDACLEALERALGAIDRDLHGKTFALVKVAIRKVKGA